MHIPGCGGITVYGVVLQVRIYYNHGMEGVIPFLLEKRECQAQ